MRRQLLDSPVRTSLLQVLPAVLQADDVTRRWMEGLDDVLAPVVQTLDCFTAYLDPLTAPDDFVQWLGGWIGVTDAEDLSSARRRELVASVTYLYSMRGTVAGLSHLLALMSPAEIVALDDDGAVSWSRDPGEPLPSNGVADLTVRVRGEPADVERTRALVAAWAPAHVTVEVKVEGEVDEQ